MQEGENTENLDFEKFAKIGEVMAKIELLLGVLPPIEVRPLTLTTKTKGKDGKEQVVKKDYIAILITRPAKNESEREREQ